MRKVSFKLLILLVMLLPIVNVKALSSASISATCSPSEVKPGNTVSCIVRGTSDDNVTSINASLSLSTGASIDSFVPASGWAGNDINDNKIDIYTSNDISGSFDIGTLNIKVSDIATTGKIILSISNAVFYDSADDEFAAGSTSAEFNVSSDNIEPTSTGLSSLQVTGGTLSPQLSSSNFGYTIILDSASITSFSISAVAANTSDTIQAINADTDEVLNLDNITFTTTGGKAEMLIKLNVGIGTNLVTYTLVVSKPTSSDTSTGELATLTIGEKTVNLANGKYDYEVTLDDVAEYQVMATLRDSLNFEFDDFLTPPFTLSGDTEFVIKVNPKDSTAGLSSVTYKITVKGITDSRSTSSSQGGGGYVSDNPQTGGTSVFIMASVLVISLFASMYLYKKNMSEYN